MGDAAIALDRMEPAHRAVGGSSPGRRYATQQINQSYLVMPGGPHCSELAIVSRRPRAVPRAYDDRATRDLSELRPL